MLDYWVRLYRLPITQVVVLLLPPPENTLIETAFESETTHYEYRVIKLWEENPAIFLNDPNLLPLATVAAATASEQLLQDVAKLEWEQRREVSSYVQVLAGLKFEKSFIDRA